MTERLLAPHHEDRLRELLDAVIDQNAARVLVPPYKAAGGHWFGGGNLVRLESGRLLLVGRYRNYGDARTGLDSGTRGLELAIFESRDNGRSFSKLRSWSKRDLSSGGAEVLSIEGSALHFPLEGGCELYVSSEKQIAYPEPVRAFQKPGTGIWTIDVFRAPEVESLDPRSLDPVFAEQPAPCYLHVKDPAPFIGKDGTAVLLFCSHPFAWSSSNTGYATRRRGDPGYAVQTWELVNRGPAWDVAGTRVTGRMQVPRLGAFADMESLSVYFYDGLECVRKLEEGLRSVTRPRGYSCEELGGALYGFDADFPRLTRLSRLFPQFVSPWGTGCSRYVDVLVTDEGLFATWQQSREDESQPLVGNFLSTESVARILR